MNELIHIACCVDDNYSPHCGTMLCSLFNSNKENSFHIHLFSGRLNRENRLKFEALFSSYHHSYTFYNINENLFKDVPVKLRHISIAAYYRILVPGLLEPAITKIIYFDSDLIVRSNIRQLWECDLQNNIIGAVQEQISKSHYVLLDIDPSLNYFNSGVMLIDLNKWREEAVESRCLDYLSKNKNIIKYWDQDVLNVILKKKWTDIGNRWNVAHKIYFAPYEYAYLSTEVIHELATNPSIVHFSGASKPWGIWNRHPFKPEYLYYRSLTPWKKEKRISLREVIIETYDRLLERIIVTLKKN